MKDEILVNNKKILFLTIILIGVIGLGLVITTAYAANIKYQINATLKQNNIISGEIETLNVQINEATNIQTLENKAQIELGMVYPQMDEFVFIASEAKPSEDFAMIIKSEAYQ
jgi:cell division protein FtsL